VFYEPDLRFLQALQNKYRDTEADQTRLTKAISLQLELKKKAARQDEFETRVRKSLTPVIRFPKSGVC
jgi:3-dehydroquinate synthetase